jgi:hypothetical protein
MSAINKKPPKFALALLHYPLPNLVKDDIAGDLIEEFSQSIEILLISKYIFRLHTLTLCWRYNMNNRVALSFGLASASIELFYALI